MPNTNMSHRGGGHANNLSSSSSSSTSSFVSKTRSLTSPLLSNSSFGSLDYFASPFESVGPRPARESIESISTIRYASFSNTPTMPWPVPVPAPHLGSHVRSPSSPTPSTASYAMDLHSIGLAALGVPLSPTSPSLGGHPVSATAAELEFPSSSPSKSKSAADMRRKSAMHRRTVLFPEARVVNWARPFRAQGHAQQQVDDVAQDLLPSPQFNLEDICQDAMQVKPIDMALFGASAQRQRRLCHASPSLSPASTDSSAGPLTPEATPPLSDGPEPQLRVDGTWQVGSEGKGLGIDKVQHGLHRLSWADASENASPVLNHPLVQVEVEEILLNDDHDSLDLDQRNSYIATSSILEDYARTDDVQCQVKASPSPPASPEHDARTVKESTTQGTISSNPFEFSSLLSSSSLASLSSVPTTVSEVQQMRQAAEDLMSSLRQAQSTAIARAYSSPRPETDAQPSPSPRSRVASTSRIRRKAVPSIEDAELEESSSVSSGQSSPTFEQDLATPQVAPPSPSPVTVRKGFYALRAAAQSVPTFMLSKAGSSLSPTASSSSTSIASTQLLTPTTPTFPIDGSANASPASVQVKQVPFQVHLEPAPSGKTHGPISGGYMTRSQTLALQEQQKMKEKDIKEAKRRRGLARFFRSER